MGFIMAIPKPFMTSPKEGSETVVYLASSPDVEQTSGAYWEELRTKSSEESYTEDVAERLWDVSA